MIRGIRYKVGIFAVAPDDDAVFIVAEICHPKPCCSFGFVEIFLLLKQLDNFLRFSAIPYRLFTCPDIKIDTEPF